MDEKRRRYLREYYQQPEAKEYRREYYQRPEVKKHRKAYYKKYMKEYSKRPEVKERMKKYRNSPKQILKALQDRQSMLKTRIMQRRRELLENIKKSR